MTQEQKKAIITDLGIIIHNLIHAVNFLYLDDLPAADDTLLPSLNTLNNIHFQLHSHVISHSKPT